MTDDVSLMAALTIVLLIVLTAFLRIAICTWRGITGVDFGIGVGPSLWRWQVRAGVIRLRLLPIGDSAKLPMTTVGEGPAGFEEVCQVPTGDQRLIAAATLVPPLVVVLGLLPWVDLPWVIERMWDECGALIGPTHGINLVHGLMFMTVWTPSACATTALIFFIINALPSPLTTGGFLLDMNGIGWMNQGWVKVVLCLYPLAIVVLVLLAVLI